VRRVSPEFAPPPRPWVSPSTALTVVGPDTDLTCPRPTGTTSLSSLTLNDSRGPGIPLFLPSAARPGGLLEPAEAFLDLLLILRLGQFSLSDLNQFGSDCGLDEALNEAHECSK